MKSEIMITESTQNRLQPASNGSNDESLFTITKTSSSGSPDINNG